MTKFCGRRVLMAQVLLASSVLALGAAVGAPALAQSVGGKATYGEDRLESGFSPDPYSIELQSGGNIAGSSISSDCEGFIADAPDYRLNFTAGSSGLPLIFGVESDWDTTLIINAPDGQWYCDDDRGSGVNPLVRFNDVMSGSYEVWVGTYSGSDLRPATLHISELEDSLEDDQAGTVAPTGDIPDPSLSPTYTTLNLASGFTPDPRRVDVSSGGSAHASSVGEGCAGYVAAAPDVRLNFTGGNLPLYLSVNSRSDTTLLVNGPDGSWYCDDDSGEGVNPLVTFGKPASGQYDIWVGTFSDSSLQDATLVISELYSE